MANIKYPVLDFKSSLEAFHQFAGIYNSDKPLKEQLRPQHSKLFSRILRLLARQLYEHNKLFNDTPLLRELDNTKPVELSTNRKALSWVENTIQINGNTVYRQLLRLMDAGVIDDKVNHGSQMNFELLINPELLLITDYLNKEYKPSSKFLKTKKSDSKASLNTNFTPEDHILEKEHFNNSDITVKKESPPTVRDVKIKEQERTEKKNPVKEHWGISQNFVSQTYERRKILNLLSTPLKEKEQLVAPIQKNRLREYQKGAARWFYWYVMNELFEGRSINIAHLENTIHYVEQHYFINCHSLEAVENTRRLYQWRIDKAKRTIERHEINMQWIFPGQYLDLNRKGINPQTGKPYMSFINTASWPKKYEQLQKAKIKKSVASKDQDLLNQQIRLYLKNPNLNQFRRCEAYVKKNIPHLMGHFLGQFTNLNLFNYA